MTGPSILYEDNHILIAVKSPGVPVQLDASKDEDFHSQIKAYVKHKYNKPGEVFIGLVHRLDRMAGGVMVFARTSKAASRLSDQIRKHEIDKTYAAVVRGVPAEKNGRLKHHLIKDEKTNMSRVVPANFSGAKSAELEYETVESKDGYSLLKIRLLTGRHHQIRVQFLAAGHPLCGDHRYGGKEAEAEGDLALWACRLALMHPVKKEKMEFICPLPPHKPWKMFKLDSL